MRGARDLRRFRFWAKEVFMRRREMFRAILAGAGAVVGLRQASAAAAPDTPPLVPKVAYHLADLEKVGFVLGNIRNHYTGLDGRVEIALVVHGPALAAFRGEGLSSGLSNRFAGLVKDGLSPFACANTMMSMGMMLTDLLPGFASADTGGVVKLAELQSQGYAYIRP
jgi:intracellular sulfur oxidation DsrE/DsrF family protein